MNRLISLLTFMICISSCRQDPKPDCGIFGPKLQNSFIWYHEDDSLRETRYSVGFRKSINLKEAPSGSRIMIFADSRYVLWINGKYAGRGPCRFDPKGPQYDVLDIGQFLQRGRNQIAVLVQGNVTGSLKIMKHRPGLTAVIRAGKREFATDSTWACSRNIPEQMISDIWTWSCILDSIDATGTDFNWQSAGFDESGWTRALRIPGDSWGPLKKRYIPLLRETDIGSGSILLVRNGIETDSAVRELPASLPVKFRSGDEIVIDAGKLSLTYWTAKINAEKGTELVFSPCQDFIKGQTVINYNCITRYKARDGEQTYMSTETFGFRYLNIKVNSGSFTLDSIRFTSRLYPEIILASFECNDEFLNRTWKQASYTSEVLCEDGYVDSAERAEWMADVGMIQYPVSRMVVSGQGEDGTTIWSDPRLLHNMLLHTAQSQMPDGRLKAHHPSDRFDLHWYIEDYSCLWVQGLRQYYENTADTAFVNDMWPVLKKQLSWFIDRKNPCGLITAREFFIHLDNPMRYQVCQGATVNAFIYKAFTDAAHLADLLGKDDDAILYSREADSLKRAYNRVLFDKKTGSFLAAVNYPDVRGAGSLPDLKMVEIQDPATKSKAWSDGNVQWIKKGEKVPATVHAALVALNRGIVSDEHLASVQDYLIKHCGELKNPYTHLILFDALYKIGQDSLDLKVLNIIRSRWKSMVSRVSPGTAAEGFETQGYLCHPFGLVPAYVLPSYVLGVRKPAPVWERSIVIEPRPGDLLRAKGVGLTEFGPVPVEWEKDGKTFRFSFTIPQGIEAFIRLPCSEGKSTLILNGRDYEFTKNGMFAAFWVRQGTYTGILNAD